VIRAATPSVSPRETKGTNIIERDPTLANSSRSSPSCASASTSSADRVDAKSASPLRKTLRKIGGAAGPRS
jgi:hypothetical protein